MKVQHRFSDSLFLFRSFLFPLFLLAVLISPSPAQAAEEVFFYHNDAVGSPVAMTDSTGAVVWEADYQPFGDEWNLSETKTNAHRFTGKERDAETGLHYFGARHYDANLGRFISIDPALISGRPASTLTVPQQHNFYAYAINNPYRYVDPDGEFAIAIGAIVGAFVINTFLPSTVNAPPDNQALVNSQTGVDFAVGAAIIETTGFFGGKFASRTRGIFSRRVMSFPSKNEARKAFGGKLGNAANRFFRDATSKSRDFKISNLSKGGKRFEFFSPAKNKGYGKKFIQEVNSEGQIIREFKDTLGPKGLIERKFIHGGQPES